MKLILAACLLAFICVGCDKEIEEAHAPAPAPGTGYSV